MGVDPSSVFFQQQSFGGFPGCGRISKWQNLSFSNSTKRKTKRLAERNGLNSSPLLQYCRWHFNQKKLYNKQCNECSNLNCRNHTELPQSKKIIQHNPTIRMSTYCFNQIGYRTCFPSIIQPSYTIHQVIKSR